MHFFVYLKIQIVVIVTDIWIGRNAWYYVGNDVSMFVGPHGYFYSDFGS